MSTDRELLELAAKAKGFQVKGWIGDRLSFFDPILDSAEYEWNPLTDDGDALRLAVQLNLIPGYMRYSDMHTTIYEGEAKLAETRRAIVRAAAEIGRAAMNQIAPAIGSPDEPDSSKELRGDP